MNDLAKYSYSFARVSAMKSFLLDRRFYEEMVEVKSIDAIAELLTKTKYKPYLQEEAIIYSAPSLVENAASKHFSFISKKLMKISPNEIIPVLQGLLRKWEIKNLEIIFSNKKAGISWEETEPYIVEIEISRKELQRIYEAEDILKEAKRNKIIKNIMELSKKLFPTALEKIFLEAVKNKDSLKQLYLILDSYYYYHLEKELKGSGKVSKLLEIVKEEIDSKNAINVLRLQSKGVESKKIKEFLIKGGNYYKEIEKIVDKQEDISTFIEKKWKAKGEIVEIEEQVERFLAEKRMKTFYRMGVSPEAIIGFLFMQEEEMNNIRKIVRGKDIGMDKKEILEKMVIM